MTHSSKATRIDLFSFASPQMRAFHMSWLAFFSAFFAWFGIAPLMPVVRDDLGLTQAQIGNTIIASVAVTVFVRILIGPLCDRFGARITYTALLVLGSLPVMSIGLARSYESFLLFRLAIGVIGAAFVVTQYHTSVMFASSCVGTANATTAGWGNLGGGVTQMAMPLLCAALFVGAGGNAGAVAAGFLFRSEALPMQQGLLYLGMAVTEPPAGALLVRFRGAEAVEGVGLAARAARGVELPARGLAEA